MNLLYYPKIEPPHNWLRRTLLLTDSIGIFVPSVDDLDFTDRLYDLQQSLPDGTIREVTADTDDVKLPPDMEFYLDRALGLIAREPAMSGYQVNITAAGAGIEGYAFVHESKFTDKSFAMLSHHGLAGDRNDKIARNLLPGLIEDGWHLVEDRAADLVIACAAAQASRRHKLDTITDDPLAFGVTAIGGSAPADSAILTALIKFYVPEQVGSLEMSAYLEVRESLTGLRAGLESLVRAVRQEHWTSQSSVDSLLAAIAEFDEECGDYQRSRTARKFGSWAPLLVGALAAASSPFIGEPAVEAGVAGGAFVIQQVVDRFAPRSPEPPHSETYRLLSGIEPTIMQRARIDQLAG
ncbi:hypothetical protein ACQP2X_42330 [Actinoplanes sp. CA-131856]